MSINRTTSAKYIFIFLMANTLALSCSRTVSIWKYDCSFWNGLDRFLRKCATHTLLAVYFVGSNEHVYELTEFVDGTWTCTELTLTTGGNLVDLGAGLTSFSNNNSKHMYFCGEP